MMHPLALGLSTLWDSAAPGSMFHLGLSIGEKMLRPVLVYLFLVFILRIFGKRELAQLNPFDLVVLLSLSNTVQNAIIGDDNTITGGLIGAFTLLTINYLVVRFVFKHRRLDQLIEGSPTILIDKGRIRRRELARELLTEAELTTVVHRQGFASLAEVEQCIIEPGGGFYVQGKSPATDTRRHGELLTKLEELGKLLAELKAEARSQK